LKELGARAGVSERFLAQVESGDGNISVARLEDVGQALGTTAAKLLTLASQRPKKQTPGAGLPPRALALLGLRGAGKSTVGACVAKRMKVPFIELDALVAREAGMSLDTIFEIHGEAYFRRLERETLEKLLDETGAKGVVVATGGSIVNDAETFALLRRKTTTLWLKARAQDHWDRVVAQGDARPMKGRANAMSELKALLRERKPLYAQADYVVDTSSEPLEETVERVLGALRTSGRGRVRRSAS
jgi:XRE family aerobic/anaerobic benzoate catabolism transcriptional regulator